MMKNKRFSLLDVGRETVHLVRARSTFVAVFVATFTLVLLVGSVSSGYIRYTQRHGDRIWLTNEMTLSCEKNILYPWRNAELTRNMSSTNRDDFYTLFKQTCSSIFKDPPEELGFFTFRNGTFTLNSGGFVLADSPIVQLAGGDNFSQLCYFLWFSWGRAAVACGLLAAPITTMTYYSRPSHRDAIQMPSQKLTAAFGEQFSHKVLLGFIRVSLTDVLISILRTVVSIFIGLVRCIVVKKTVDLNVIVEVVEAEPNKLWYLANPLPYLFLLSTVAAALEPGMWGFKALWRGIQLARGNRLKSYFIFLTLFAIVSLDGYLSWLLIAIERDRAGSITLLEWLGRSIMRWSFSMMGHLPGLFLIPVFYFLCKAWREKAATMA